MALDYSKLTDEELEAIAADDYSKLSDKTLEAMAADPGAKKVTEKQPTIDLIPQAVSVARQVGAVAPEALATGADIARQGAAKGAEFLANRPVMQTAADIAGIASHGVPWGSIARQAIDPSRMTLGEMASGLKNVVTQGAGAVGAGARGLGSALVQGAVAPESLLMAPYQMAAYEQDKIRANPNAPGLEFNPYAQVQRGEFVTQGQAAAANQRAAVRNMPYGNVTPEERRILDEDRLRMEMRLKAARKVLGQP